MITIQGRGRLGNIMFQNCAASILSKKFDIKVQEYLLENELALLRPKFHKADRVLTEQRKIRDADLLPLLAQTEINFGLDLEDFFQLKNFVITYRQEILDNFDLQYSEEHQDDLFVHVRLGDCIKRKRILEIDYYANAIKKINFKKGYIASDTPTHELVTALMRKFDLKLYKGPRVQTLDFGKNFKNLVLSGGTFSWWLGFLSRAENIYYPSGRKRWYGDIFVFNEWTPVSVI